MEPQFACSGPFLLPFSVVLHSRPTTTELGPIGCTGRPWLPSSLQQKRANYVAACRSREHAGGTQHLAPGSPASSIQRTQELIPHWSPPCPLAHSTGLLHRERVNGLPCFLLVSLPAFALSQHQASLQTSDSRHTGPLTTSRPRPTLKPQHPPASPSLPTSSTLFPLSPC